MNGEEVTQNEQEIDRIRLLQYENLRENFNKNLIQPILGKDYYNMGMDVYTADQFTTEDLLREFKNLKYTSNLYTILFRISIALNIILLILRIIN